MKTKKKKIKPPSIITSVIIKKCPNCKEKWNGHECKNCGFDATEVDIY